MCVQNYYFYYYIVSAVLSGGELKGGGFGGRNCVGRRRNTGQTEGNNFDKIWRVYAQSYAIERAGNSAIASKKEKVSINKINSKET